MRKKSLLTACLCLPLLSGAQYYYQDIYSTLQVNEKQALYKQLHVSGVEISSLDAAMERSNDLLVRTTISKDYAGMESSTRSGREGVSVLSSRFDGQGRIIYSRDSSQNGINTSSYRYDARGNPISITLHATSPGEADISSQVETHTYYYDEDNHLQKMILSRANADSAVIEFTADEKGDIVKEQEKGSNIAEAFYYKYDPRHQLTDVAQFSPGRRRILPALMFDYDEQGRLTAMTTIKGGSADYTIWKYTYDQQGLRTAETCYEKGRTLLGAIQYRYTYFR